MAPRLEREELASSYGYAYSFLKSDEELWSLFQKAVTGENDMSWSPQRFMLELQNSNWYKNTAPSTREAMELQATQPEAWKQKIDKQYQTLKDLANSMGATVSQSVLKEMASDSIMYAWNESIINNRMAKYLETVKGTNMFGGGAGDVQADLHKIALNYGQKVTNETIKNWVVNIARGEATANDFKAKMADQASAVYPAYSEQIRKGMTMNDVAGQYIQQMAETLELNPANIDIFDKHVQRALKHPSADKNENGGTPEYSLYDFERQLRQDARWQSTKNAQDQAMSLTTKIMQDWGWSA